MGALGAILVAAGGLAMLVGFSSGALVATAYLVSGAVFIGSGFIIFALLEVTDTLKHLIWHLTKTPK